MDLRFGFVTEGCPSMHEALSLVASATKKKKKSQIYKKQNEVIGKINAETSKS